MSISSKTLTKLTAVFLAVVICQQSLAGNERVEVPITIEGPRAIMMVSVGASAPVPVVLDTGAAGLRIKADYLKPTDYRRTGKRNKVMYIGETGGLDGEIAVGTVKLGNFPIAGQTSFQVIDRVICTQTHKDCKGYAAKYAGTLGISIFKRGKRKNENQLVNPLIANDPVAYIIRLPKPGENTGALIINPTAAERARFTKIKLSQNTTQGIPACIGRYCFDAVLDCGAPRSNINYPKPKDLKATGLPVEGDNVVEGTKVPIEFGGPAGLTHVFEAGRGQSHFNVTHKDKQVALLGINTFRYLDVLYNFQAGIIGLAAKQ